jgi:hypothetical protein
MLFEIFFEIDLIMLFIRGDLVEGCALGWNEP